jgi:hypothetical protein
MLRTRQPLSTFEFIKKENNDSDLSHLVINIDPNIRHRMSFHERCSDHWIFYCFWKIWCGISKLCSIPLRPFEAIEERQLDETDAQDDSGSVM